MLLVETLFDFLMMQSCFAGSGQVANTTNKYAVLDIIKKTKHLFLFLL